LPAAERDAAAEWILDYVEQLSAPGLTPEQLAGVRASLAERRFLTEEETRTLYRRYGVSDAAFGLNARRGTCSKFTPTFPVRIQQRPTR
jgi:hypothetical protein